jgi:hypothetical protein
MILIIVLSLDLLLGQIMISKHVSQSFICRPFSKSYKIHFGASMQPLFPSLDSHFSQVRVSMLLVLFLPCCISSLGRKAYCSLVASCVLFSFMAKLLFIFSAWCVLAPCRMLMFLIGKIISSMGIMLASKSSKIPNSFMVSVLKMRSYCGLPCT